MPTWLIVLACVYAFSVAALCLLGAAVLCWDSFRRRLADHRDRSLWARIDAEATSFRSELDSADWQEELRHYRGAA